MNTTTTKILNNHNTMTIITTKRYPQKKTAISKIVNISKAKTRKIMIVTMTKTKRERDTSQHLVNLHLSQKSDDHQYTFLRELSSGYPVIRLHLSK